jgi:zinc protease
VDADYLIVSASGLSAHKQTLFDLLADISLRPTFAPDEIERYRTRTLSDIQASLARAGTLASAALARLVYGEHPYGNFASGTPATLPAITRDDLRRFHETYFAPNVATLFLAGDITPGEAQRLAQTYLGQWAQKSVPPAPPSPTSAAASASTAPGNVRPRVTIIDRPGAAQTEVRIGARTSGYNSPERIPGLVAITVLGLGQFEGRLTREIRVKRGLTYGAGSNIAREKEAGAFTISTFTKNESSGEVLRIALDEAKRLAREPTPAEELEARKNYLNGSFAVSVATPDGVLRRLIPAVLYGNGVEDLTRRTERIQAVRPEQIRQIMQSLLAGTPDLQVVLVGDRSAIEEQIKPLAGELTVVAASEINLLDPSLKAAPQTAAGSAGGNTPGATSASPQELAQGRALLDATIKAHGGDAFLNLSSLRATGQGRVQPTRSGAGGTEAYPPSPSC